MTAPSRPVVTRFAPSPTGFLHIGGARTALFNWLFARHHGGSFRLRIEDTDRKRSTDAAIAAILDGLAWLGLDHDGEVVYQFSRAARHAELARDLLAKGRAYHCYASPEELEEMRATARVEGRPMRYDGRWRDRDPAEAPAGVDPVVRLKMPQEGETVIEDLVQGAVTVRNDQLDDMVLLRADGTPTYMLSVVVDDHDMDITHVIRGDDHLTNAFRQNQLYRALDWEAPHFAHIPLIHGPDGAKLSKRHGALSVQDYRAMGFLPEAICNYLLRLGWSHGDAEIISRERAIGWFDLDAVGKSAARFDFAKLENLNGHYMREADDERLLRLTVAALATPPADAERSRLAVAMPLLKARAKTIRELADAAAFCLVRRPLVPDDKAKAILSDEARHLLGGLQPQLAGLAEWTPEVLEATIKAFAGARGIKLGQVAQPLRAALTGRSASPGIYEVLAVLGRDESLARIGDQATARLQ